MRYPDATVDIVEPFGCELNSYAELAGGDGQQLKTKEDVMKYLTSKSSKVPLMEICPVNEEPSYAEDVDDDDRDVDMDHIADGLELYRYTHTCIKMWLKLKEARKLHIQMIIPLLSYIGLL